MKRTTVFTRILSVLTALVLLAASLAACGSDDAGDTSAYLDDQLAYAKEKVEGFSRTERRSLALLSDELFSKASVAAMLIDGDTTEEDYAKIARYLSLDSITVADASRSVVASYPQGEEGKSLKEIEDKREFINIIKNVTVRQMTDPVRDDQSGSYSLLIGVKSADGSGAVIIGLTTDAYDELYGYTLAEKCGRNTLILKDDTVLSSTLKGVGAGADLKTLGVTKDDLSKDSFTLTADGKSYTCKSVQAGNYTVVCAAE